MVGNNRLSKEKIIEVAAAQFCEKGYAGTSIRDISHALNISIASLYYYFRNKEHLLFTIIQSIGEDLLSVLRKVSHDCDDPLEGLCEMLSRQIVLTEKKRAKVKIYVEEQHNLSKKSRKIIYRQHREIYDIYAQQLRKLKRKGIISSESIAITAFAIFGMVNWCYRWYKSDGKLSIEEVKDRLINLLLNGMLTRNG